MPNAKPASKADTPTLDAMLACKAESQAIGNFLTWLEQQGMCVAKPWTPEGSDRPRYWPINDNIETLLARYFEIDLNAAEREKQSILDSLSRAGRKGKR